MLSSKRSQKGSHHLEFALVLPILLIIIFGAFDINTALQGYTALQQGVKKSLRCAYPTDGECVTTDPGTQSANFQVTGVRGQAVYNVDMTNLSATAKWIVKPAYQVRAWSDYSSVLRYETPDPDVRQTADFSYLLQTYSIPYFAGDDLDPRIGTPPEISERSGTPRYNNNYPLFGEDSADSPLNYKRFRDDDINVSRTNWAGEGQTVKVGETKKFRLPNPYSKNQNCFVAKEINEPASVQKTPDFTKSCDKRNAEIAFHVKGTTVRVGQSDLNNPASGAVEITLIKYLPNGRTVEEPLGGRLINDNPGSNDDFTARGLELDKCKRDKDGKIITASCTYSNASDDFTRNYHKEGYFHRNLTVPYDTDFKLVFHVKASNKSIGWHLDEVRLFSSVFIPQVIEDLDCSDVVKLSQADRASCQTKYGISSTKPENAEIIQTGSYVWKEAACPEVPVSSPEECLAACAAAANIQDARNISCITEEKESTKDWLVDDCSRWPLSQDDLDSLFGVRVKRAEYSRLPENDVKLATLDNDPHELIQKSAVYSCMNVETKLLEGDRGAPGADPSIPVTSLFTGLHYLAKSDLKDVARREAIKLGISSDVYIEPHFQTVVDVFESEPPYPYRMDFVSLDPDSKRDFGPYTGVLPAECTNGSYTCSLEFLGYTGTAATTDIAWQRAELIGAGEITASFPQARIMDDCKNGPAYCTTLTAEAHEEIAAARASMRIPLRLLAMNEITLSYSAAKRFEKNYSK